MKASNLELIPMLEITVHTANAMNTADMKPIPAAAGTDTITNITASEASSTRFIQATQRVIVAHGSEQHFEDLRLRSWGSPCYRIESSPILSEWKSLEKGLSMYYGKKDELETQSATGIYYSIQLECETYCGEGFPTDEMDIGLEGDSYDNWDEACNAINGDESHLAEAFETFLAQHPEIAWVAASIERSELVDGNIRIQETPPLYPLMLTQDKNGSLTWSGWLPDPELRQ